MILVICALAGELRAFDAPPNVRVVAAGVGPVEAAIATARELASASYSCAIGAGIGGAFRTRAAVGDATLVTVETLADFGLEGGAPMSLPGGAQLVERVEADAVLVRRCATLRDLKIARGLTVSQVTQSDATAARLAARYGADVESMEGFAVLRAAADAGIPAVEVRGISNIVGERARGEWDFAAGARATATALAAIVTLLSRSNDEE